MEDFIYIDHREKTKGKMVLTPTLQTYGAKDLAIKGHSFYAVWDEEKGEWLTNIDDLGELIDRRLDQEFNKLSLYDKEITFIDYTRIASNNVWMNLNKVMSTMSDNYGSVFDSRFVFKSEAVTREDYSTKRLNYDLEEKEPENFNELMSVLYDPEEQAKIKWAIGAMLAGETKKIQKFLVFYGPGGTGKSTILNIIEMLAGPYCATIDAKAITSGENGFSLSSLKDNPLCIVQHDVDLSKIKDNSILNSLVAHEQITINEKFKQPYSIRVNGFLFLGTNKPVLITDSNSGLIRRLIEVNPTGNKIPTPRYRALMANIQTEELGAIATQCINFFRSMGPNYYNDYKAISMMYKTNSFYNFVEECSDEWREEDGIPLKKAYYIYKKYCEESGITPIQKYRFKTEFSSYFREFRSEAMVKGERYRNYYSEFKKELFIADFKVEDVFIETPSWLDEHGKDYKAQYASEKGTPLEKWENVKTTLKEIDTTRLHYVQLPVNHIVIDFDLKDADGNKSLELNLKAMREWPDSYAEVSKSGQGIHLHYIYPGDPYKLMRVYKEGIEIKVFTGNSSLRRKLTKCNNVPIAVLTKKLPEKEESPIINVKVVTNERKMRASIEKALRKEVHANTKPNIDFIYTVLSNAYDTGVIYDLSDMRTRILAFASKSTNHAKYCIQVVSKMPFKSEKRGEPGVSDDEQITFFDIEVFPNLLFVSWKYDGIDKYVDMYNPTPEEIASLFRQKLVGFNNRRYDNHVLYARYIGYSIEEVAKYSQKLIGSKDMNKFFGEAYSVSYTDVYDFSSKKQSLKKFEIELGLHHQELGLPWDKPVPEEKWPLVAEYCHNDVKATEETFHARKEDFVTREILAKLSGYTVNDPDRKHIAKILFGDDKNPQSQFVYTNLSDIFPGYEYIDGKSIFLGEDVGNGGYVYAEPGMYGRTPVLDVASMHPTSIIELNLFGPYTKNYKEFLDLRIAIKHEELDTVLNYRDGALKEFLDSGVSAKSLSKAFKLVLNRVYGYTSAKFDNPFRDPRNIDNIVAKRGALFMCMLKHEVQNRGWKVAHIKTDSIKIPDADPEITQFVVDSGKEYGYTFEVENTYDRFCLVNDSVYIARKIDGLWDPTGAQFAHPYVFKSLFSKEIISFDDKCETKSVSGSSNISIDMNSDLPEGEHNYIFVGRVGRFCPMKDGYGGDLVRTDDQEKYVAVVGSKGYKWMESEVVQQLHLEDHIDNRYFENLVQEAIDSISKFGDIEWFLGQPLVYPWTTGEDKQELPF